jgi:hypothetical protein
VAHDDIVGQGPGEETLDAVVAAHDRQQVQQDGGQALALIFAMVGGSVRETYRPTATMGWPVRPKSTATQAKWVR